MDTEKQTERERERGRKRENENGSESGFLSHSLAPVTIVVS